MKSLLASFVLIGLFSGCDSDKKIAPVEPDKCSNPIYTRVAEIKDVRTRVILKNYASTTADNLTVYLIDQPDTGFTVPWLACNLPEQYKKHNLQIRISGYRLTYPGIERSNDIGSPIELTRIELDSTPK